MRPTRLFAACAARRAFSAAAAPPSTIDAAELSKFAALSSLWWADPAAGPFAGLHRMNAVRVPVIRRALARDFLPRRTAAAPAGAPLPSAAAPLAGLSVLDAGCGGGILSEALARLGADVTGLDATAEAVAAAAAHARLDPAVAARTRFVCSSAEALAASGARFDGVVCSEVLEHVAAPADFLAALGAMLRPGGHAVVTTINRSLPAFWAAILGAEYALRLVPPGTHEWAKFVKPEELARALERAGCAVELVTGFAYNPLSQRWSATRDTSVNYAVVARKRE